MKQENNVQRTMLVILDGWGLRSRTNYNAPLVAKTPTLDHLMTTFPSAELYAAEKYVGLPKGYIGNSEVGHIHLGAGKIIPQDLLRINAAIKDGSFFKNPALLQAMRHARRVGKTLHLLGLLSDGGVHSHIDHLIALLKLAKQQQVPEVHVHCFLDGRDTPQKSAKKYLDRIAAWTSRNHLGEIKTIMGRFYAMDRDNRWNREHKAYAAMAMNDGFHYKRWQDALVAAYKRGETDEFVQPCVIDNKDVDPSVSDGDAIVFFNFRSDRAREITRAFIQGKFNKFKRRKILDLMFVSLTQYDKKIKTKIAFPLKPPGNVLGQIIQDKGLLQLRIAETEKYAHVTYFFNSGRERPFDKEERIMIPSPRIRTYDKKPQMSATKVTSAVLKQLDKRRHHLIVLNFANSDMVGHTGEMRATVDACTHVDACMKKIVDRCQKNGYHLLITADHGNAEEMSGPHKTTHTTNKVPVMLVAADDTARRLKNGCIAQISPTILKLMGLPRPKDMLQPLF